MRESLRLALQLHEAGDLSQAEARFQTFLLQHPQDPEACFYLGNLLVQSSRFDQAIACYQDSIRSAPTIPGVHANLGLALVSAGRHLDAIPAYQAALKLDRDFADAHSNLGGLLIQVGQIEQGVAHLNRALSLRPGLVEARGSLGLAQLLRGDLENGFVNYEARLHLRRQDMSGLAAIPRWEGNPINGKTVLVRAEQGFGDTIQFVRYVPQIAALGARVVLGCPEALHRLLNGRCAIAQIVGAGASLSRIDFQCLLLSLPRIFKTTLQTIPRSVYLSADPPEQSAWAARLPSTQAPRVGLVWAGAAHNTHDKLRSLTLADFADLLSIEGVQYVSLQKGPAAQEVAQSRRHNLIDFADALHDFAATAALIANLDLVITVDTAVAHLAGAMGNPVWILIHCTPDWRWLLNRSDSVWYPSAKLFRQRCFADWTVPLAELSDHLRAWVAARR
jgi:tetratricopeptide (TPR) repeat protein